MRKRYHFDPRLSRPLHLEIFEDRCLFSVGNSLLAPPLLSPRLLEPPTILTPGLTRVAVTSDNLPGMTARTGADLPNGAGTAGSLSSNASVQVGIGNNLPEGARVAVATSARLAGGIAATLPEMIGIASTTNPQVFLGVQVSPVAIVAASTVAAANLGAGVDLKLNDAGGAQRNVGMGSDVLPALSIRPVDGVNVTLGGTTSPPVGVQLNAELVHGDGPNVVIRVDVGGSQGSHLPGNPITEHVGAHLTWDREAGPSGLGDNIVVASNGVGNGEPQKDTIAEPAGSDAALEPNPQNSQRIALLAWSTSFLVGVPDNLAGEAPAERPGSIESAAAAGPATIQSGASDVDNDAPLPSPRRQGPLADLFPFDLASLEGDIQAFLQQIEQLGGELSSLLARLNLSPWLMAIAVAAVAGEIARLRLQGPHRRPQLAACEGATLAWFPDLTGPWSPKEP